MGEDGIQDRAQDTHSKTTLQEGVYPKPPLFFLGRHDEAKIFITGGQIHYFTSLECQNFRKKCFFLFFSVTNLCHSQCEDFGVVYSHPVPKGLTF